MSKDRIFNRGRTRLHRTYVARSENLSTVLIFFALAALLTWVMTQREAYDPTERDLSVELLRNGAPSIELYNRPLKPWEEPGQQVNTATFDLTPFPASTLDTEWQPAGRIKRFQAENLYEKINGEAEKFIKQGFVELSFLRLRSQQNDGEITIELFDQGGLGGSLGIFSEYTSGREVEERSGVRFVPTGAGVIGRIDRYFFRVAGNRQGDDINKKAASLVSAFGSLGREAKPQSEKEAEEPAGFKLLNRRLGIAESDIQYQENNVFQYDFAQRFWFGKAETRDEARLFIHIAESSAAAEALVSALTAEHDNEYSREASDGDYLVFQHRYLGTYFAVTQMGRYVFGAERLKKSEAIESLLEPIRKTLRNDEE